MDSPVKPENDVVGVELCEVKKCYY